MEKKLKFDIEDLEKDPKYFSDKLRMEAQELVSLEMEKKEISKIELAKKMKQTKGHISALLSEDRNLTLNTLANVLFHLGAEAHISVTAIGNHPSIKCNYGIGEEINLGQITKNIEYTFFNYIASQQPAEITVVPTKNDNLRNVGFGRNK